LTVQFSDQSSGATAWAWDFGDGSGQSNLQNPSYVYSVIGSYTVTLTATNSFGSNSTTRTVNVTTRPPYDPAQFMPFF
jgi:PKD repeat protein